TMLLHASELSFTHPKTSTKIHLKADLHEEFKRVMSFMKMEL
ncbi:MAG: pseudouridylate synthase, partial [Pedobacter sp.]